MQPTRDRRMASLLHKAEGAEKRVDIPPPPNYFNDEFTYLKERFPIERDDLVYFNPEAHKYYIRTMPAAPFISVTTFWKDFIPAFPAWVMPNILKSVHSIFKRWYDDVIDKVLAWRERRGAEEVLEAALALNPCIDVRDGGSGARLWPEKYEVFVSKERFDEVIREMCSEETVRVVANGPLLMARFAHLQPLPPPLGAFSTGDMSRAWVRDGVALHANIERFYNNGFAQAGEGGEVCEEPTGVDWDYFKAFVQEQDDLEILRTELRVFDSELCICGTVDALARRRSTGAYVLLDWKRSQKLKADEADDVDGPSAKFESKAMKPPFDSRKATDRFKYQLQLNMYAIILGREYDIDVEEMYLCVIHPSNPSYLLLPVPNFEHDKTLRESINQVLNARMREVGREAKRVADGERRREKERR